MLPRIFLAKETSFRRALIRVLGSYPTPKMHFGKHHPRGIQPPALQGHPGFYLGISVRAKLGLWNKEAHFLVSADLGTGSQLRAVSPNLKSEFEWSKQLPSLPQTCPTLGGIPIEEEIHHFLPQQRLCWSGPLTCWIGGLSLGFFQDRGKNSS